MRLILVSVEPVYGKDKEEKEIVWLTFNLYSPIKGVISQAGIRKWEVTVTILSKMARSSS